MFSRTRAAARPLVTVPPRVRSPFHLAAHVAVPWSLVASRQLLGVLPCLHRADDVTFGLPADQACQLPRLGDLERDSRTVDLAAAVRYASGDPVVTLPVVRVLSAGITRQVLHPPRGCQVRSRPPRVAYVRAPHACQWSKRETLLPSLSTGRSRRRREPKRGRSLSASNRRCDRYRAGGNRLVGDARLRPEAAPGQVGRRPRVPGGRRAG